MDSLPLLSSIGFGILLAVSPCPLTTNLLAVSYLGIQGKGTAGALRIGIIYGIGRALAYVGLAALLSGGLLAAPRLSLFLQTRTDLFVGPLLLLVGLVLCGIISVPLSWSAGQNVTAVIAGRSGAAAPLLLGFFLALSFCPVSAALFFGSLLPLCVSTGSTLFLPLAFGLGTAVPVVISAMVLAFLARKGQELFFARLSRGETLLRRIVGAAFILFGLYFSLQVLTRLL